MRQLLVSWITGTWSPGARSFSSASASKSVHIASRTVMQIARVVGTVVATRKNRKLEGAKLLLVQPLTLEGTPRGAALLTVDTLGAGVDETVLVVMEGRAAGEALGRRLAPVDAAVVGIIDTVDLVA